MTHLSNEELWESEGGAVVPPKMRLYTSYRWMYRKYLVERKTEQEIAEEAETNQSTVNRWLKRHGLKK
jgi:hypothetical protein